MICSARHWWCHFSVIIGLLAASWWTQPQIIIFLLFLLGGILYFRSHLRRTVPHDWACLRKEGRVNRSFGLRHCVCLILYISSFPNCYWSNKKSSIFCFGSTNFHIGAVYVNSFKKRKILVLCKSRKFLNAQIILRIYIRIKTNKYIYFLLKKILS